MRNSILHEVGVFSDETSSSLHAIVAQTSPPQRFITPTRFWDEMSLELVSVVPPMQLSAKLAALFSNASTDELVRLCGNLEDGMRLSSDDQRFAEDVSFQPIIPLRTTNGTTTHYSISHIATIVCNGGDGNSCGIVTYASVPLFLLLSETLIIICGTSHRLKTALHDGLYFELASYVLSADSADSMPRSTQ